MVMMVAVALALVSYVISAFITRSWHSVSKLEFISYVFFTVAVLLSVVFARDPKIALFGDSLNPLSGIALLTLPAVMYLVRNLPENYRHKLKYILAIILSISMLTLMSALITKGTFVSILRTLFSGFTSPVSLSAYLGIFAIGIFVFTKRAILPIKHKIVLVAGAVVFLSWAASIATQEAIRPNFSSSITVGKNVLISHGVFGIGAGDYTRAWQLHRPNAVVESPYFGLDFSQGYSTITTLFATIGIIGMLAFLMLTLTALYSTFVSYRQERTKEEHLMLGILASILLYLAVLSWVISLSYAMLVVWMVVGGLGLAKARLTEFHPSRKLAFVMAPLALVLIFNAFLTVQKTRAFIEFGKAQALINKSGPVDGVGALLTKAAALYQFDAFYRAQVELIIAQERDILSKPATTPEDQEVLKNDYLKRSQKAVDAGLAAVRSNPNNYQNYVSLGRAYELALPFEKDKGFDLAKKSYQEAIKLYPSNPYLYITIARLEATAGTKEGVRVQLTEALKKKQNFADALYLMSQLEASDSKIDEALNYAIEAVRNAPNDPLTYIQAGLLYYGKRDYPNAVAALSIALQKDQNNANVAYFLALALRDGGRLDLAKTIGDELLRRNPGNADLEAFLKSLEPATTVKQETKKQPAKK
jgi:tetratricopeptide (TPR) repeat protein